MSIKTTLFVDDLEFCVLDHSMGFFQNSDYAGSPNRKTKAQPFRFTVEASKDTTFCEWAVDSAMQKKYVKIVFSPTSGMSKSTTIELLDVYCIRCVYNFKAASSQPFTVDFDLSPGIIMREGAVLLKRSWAVSDPEMPDVATVERETEDNTPRIIKQYITDRDDTELNTYERGQELYCVLESENFDNETIDIDLSELNVSLLYQGKQLQDNIIKNYTIGADAEKIPLQVIPEDYTDEQ